LSDVESENDIRRRHTADIAGAIAIRCSCRWQCSQGTEKAKPGSAVLLLLAPVKAFEPVEDFHPLGLNAFGFMPAVAVVDHSSAFPASQLAINED
jgi:hypothetical protein